MMAVGLAGKMGCGRYLLSFGGMAGRRRSFGVERRVENLTVQSARGENV